MSTTVRIEEGDRDRLRHLQLQWKELTGEDLPQQALLGLLIRHGEQDVGHLLDSLWTPPGQAAIDAWEKVQGDYGDLSSNIDDTLYGPV